MDKQEALEHFSEKGMSREHERVNTMGLDFDFDSYQEWLDYEYGFASQDEKEAISEILEKKK